jgi:hypothetical protein
MDNEKPRRGFISIENTAGRIQNLVEVSYEWTSRRVDGWTSENNCPFVLSRRDKMLVELELKMNDERIDNEQENNIEPRMGDIIIANEK